MAQLAAHLLWEQGVPRSSRGIPTESVRLILEIIHVDLKVALRMSAGRADFGSCFADDDMTAIAAFPYLHA